MCGIAGLYYFEDTHIPAETLSTMADSLRHRGPDEEGFYVGSNAAFAHRRLKIIDLRREAAQPMSDETRRYHLIFNGEIYNFKELRSEMESRHRFFSRSDTEVILRLFQDCREKAWDRIRGMFALALYDASTRELFLARDPVGIKPLYYYRDSTRLVFASELKGLFASGQAADEIDHDSLRAYLRFGYFPGRTTPYRNVYKLLPGESARVHPKGVSITRFWNVRDHLASRQSASPAQTLEALLLRSVEGHMISDVPLGAFLSGGLDSSLLVALMTRLSSNPVKTFTVGFSRMGYYDERPHASLLAKHFHTEHHEYAVDTGVEELLPQLSTAFDEPFADSSAIPTLCLARLARQQVTVALSGTGGDEVFGGYRKYMAGYWMHWYGALPHPMRSALQKTVGFLPGSRQSLWKERALLLQRFTGLDPQDRPEVQMNNLFTERELDLMLSSERKEWDPGFAPLEGAAAENLMLFDMEVYLPDDLLVKEDRCTMQFGLEARVPYLDRDVVQFMASLPLKHKVSATSTKRLFKKVAADYVPEWVLKRPKHGFGSPVAEWLKSDLRALASDALLSPNACIKSTIVSRKLQEHLAGKTDNSRQLWALLMLELWMRNKKVT